MSTSHTPGPWAVIPTLTGALSINAAPKVPVATVGGAGWHLGEDVAKANAALIAAAPELLAALQAMVRMAKSKAPPSEIVLRHALAAIAKAEGRS